MGSASAPLTSIGSPLVDHVAEHVEDAAERDVADRHGDRAAGVDDLHAAGRGPSVASMATSADAVVAEVLLDLADERCRLPCARS